MYLLKCLAALLVAALVSDVNALPLNNCTASYQAALNEALTIKEQCQGAAFYDCCQVRTPLGSVYCSNDAKHAHCLHFYKTVSVQLEMTLKSFDSYHCR